MLVGKSSDGFHFVFVECESINGSVITNDEVFGESIRKRKTQIENWLFFLEHQWNDVYYKLLEKANDNSSLPKEFTYYDSSRIHFLVVAGRRSVYTENARRRVREEDKKGIKIINYDRWCETALKKTNTITY